MIQRSPNQTRGRTPCSFSSSGRVSVACSNSGILVSRHSSLPNRNGELAASATWSAGHRLGRVPVIAEPLGAHLQMKLHARAGRLGGDAVDVGEQPLGALDRDPHLLAAGGEDLLIEQPVPRVGRHRLLTQIVLDDGGQDPHHHQPAAGPPGAFVGPVEALPDLVLEMAERIAGQLPGRQVDLQVELAELGLPGRIGQCAEYLGVLHRRAAGLVHQVELDLQADLLRIGLEPGIGQHPREDVQGLAHLLAIGAPVRLADVDRRDIPAHQTSLRWPAAVLPNPRMELPA